MEWARNKTQKGIEQRLSSTVCSPYVQVPGGTCVCFKLKIGQGNLSGQNSARTQTANWQRARSTEKECRPGKGGMTNGQNVKVISGTRVARDLGHSRARNVQSEKKGNQQNMSNHQPAFRTVRWARIVGAKCLACIRCYARVRWDVSIGCNVND